MIYNLVNISLLQVAAYPKRIKGKTSIKKKKEGDIHIHTAQGSKRVYVNGIIKLNMLDAREIHPAVSDFGFR